MTDPPTTFWDHGPDCWQRFAVDNWGDIALTPATEKPYCAMSFAERLEDDPSAEPSVCGGKWVRLVEVSDEAAGDDRMTYTELSQP